MNEETAWKIINEFPLRRSDREKYEPMQNVDYLHAQLHLLKRRWLVGDKRYITFTACDMGRILSDHWCNLYSFGSSVGSEQTLAECWDAIELDAYELESGSTGTGLDGDGSALVNRLKMDLAGLRNYPHDDSVEIICVDPD